MRAEEWFRSQASQARLVAARKDEEWNAAVADLLEAARDAELFRDDMHLDDVARALAALDDMLSSEQDRSDGPSDKMLEGEEA